MTYISHHLSKVNQLLITALAITVLQWNLSADSDHKNVILIVCDDLNDYIGHLGGHPQAHTPNMDRLAQSGVSFSKAYSNNPVCSPSRASFLSGIQCYDSGNMFWKKWYTNSILKNSNTLSEHFKANGYHTVGSGKLMHSLKKNLWHEYRHAPDYGPFWYDGKKRLAHPTVPMPFAKIGPVDGSYGSFKSATSDQPQAGWIYGQWGKVKFMKYQDDDQRDPTPDEMNAAWAIQKIKTFEKNPKRNCSPLSLLLTT